jgi:hypothetical protein
MIFAGAVTAATLFNLRQLSRIRGSGLQRGFLLLQGDAKDAPKATWGIKSSQVHITEVQVSVDTTYVVVGAQCMESCPSTCLDR